MVPLAVVDRMVFHHEIVVSIEDIQTPVKQYVCGISALLGK
jgi:hypothetical protein